VRHVADQIVCMRSEGGDTPRSGECRMLIGLSVLMCLDGPVSASSMARDKLGTAQSAA
jgi:hypothetical protein